MKNMGNMMGMMKKAQKMQDDMKKMQEELKKLTFDGEAESGQVAIQITGQGLANNVRIDKSLLSEENKEDLEDLIIIAFNKAKEEVEKHIAEENDRIMKDLQLPPGFNLPF